MNHGVGAGGPRTRVGVGGPPGIDLDAVLALLREYGHEPYPLWASTLKRGDCDVLVLLAPRARDWTVARECNLGIVVVHGSPFSNTELAELVLKGADAFISLDASADDLDRAVTTVAAGGSMLAADVARTVATVGRRHWSAPPGEFSQRERQIIEAAQARLSVKETARLLGISVRTVHETQRALFAKIGARNRAHALSLIHAAGGAQALLDQQAYRDLRKSG